MLVTLNTRGTSVRPPVAEATGDYLAVVTVMSRLAGRAALSLTCRV